jgi:hypothetical protein
VLSSGPVQQPPKFRSGIVETGSAAYNVREGREEARRKPFPAINDGGYWFPGSSVGRAGGC